MRFEVPQFIEIEDKIFGPFTWKQFVYLAGGVGIAVVLYLTTNFFVMLIVGLPLAGLAGALAFYPVNNRPFSIFLESMTQYFARTKLYLWRKKGDAIYDGKRPEETVTSSNTPVPTSTGSGITSLARKLELNALKKPEVDSNPHF